MMLHPFMTLEATGSGYHRLPVTIEVEVKVIIMVAINLVIIVPLSRGFQAREDDWCNHLCDQTVLSRDKGTLRNIGKMFKNVLKSQKLHT